MDWVVNGDKILDHNFGEICLRDPTITYKDNYWAIKLAVVDISTVMSRIEASKVWFFAFFQQ